MSESLRTRILQWGCNLIPVYRRTVGKIELGGSCCIFCNNCITFEFTGLKILCKRLETTGLSPIDGKRPESNQPTFFMQ